MTNNELITEIAGIAFKWELKDRKKVFKSIENFEPMLEAMKKVLRYIEDDFTFDDVSILDLRKEHPYRVLFDAIKQAEED